MGTLDKYAEAARSGLRTVVDGEIVVVPHPKEEPKTFPVDRKECPESPKRERRLPWYKSLGVSGWLEILFAICLISYIVWVEMGRPGLAHAVAPPPQPVKVEKVMVTGKKVRKELDREKLIKGFYKELRRNKTHNLKLVIEE